MISKKHFTKSMATILSTLTFLTAVSPCTFAEKNFNRNTTRSMSTTIKVFTWDLSGKDQQCWGNLKTIICNPDTSCDNKTAAVRKLFNKNNSYENPQFLNAHDPLSGTTLLITAASKGLVDVCKILIDNGADVNAKDDCGYTPLHEAAYRGHLKVYELLLDNGANINATDKYGRTPLYEAASGGHLKVYELLLEKCADKDTIVNAKDIDGCTFLHDAAYWGYKKVCELLLDNGADVNATDNKGKTPLDYAKNEEIEQLLLDHDAKHGSELND